MGEKDPIRIYVKELVTEYMKDYAKQDVDKIVQVMVPELDKLIAERVKFHIAAIMVHLKDSLNIPL
jgi:hypothetical protein